jgi:plastocyanin
MVKVMNQKAKTRFALAGMFIILALTMYSCGGGGVGASYGGSSSTPPVVASTVELVPCPASGTTDVSIVSMTLGFSPASIAVTVNTVVKWTNADSILHTVTSTAVPLDGTFDAQVNPRASVCFKFTSAGTFNYHCSIHPTTMIGVVTVQ